MPIIENLPFDQYLAIDAASNSFLKDMRRSPAHAKFKEPEDYDTRAKEIGSAIHMALLEPERFAEYYLVAEADDRRSAHYKGLAQDVGGHRVLTRSEAKRIDGMQNSAYQNTRFRKYMEAAGRNELSVVSKDPVTGAPVKCRFDRKGDGFWALDIKKCQDARASEFSKALTSYGYYMQVAFYAAVWEWETGEKIRQFPLVAIEEKAPHGVVLHNLDEVALILGRKHFREALDQYARCMDSEVWPSYAEEEEVINVTSWAAMELEEGVE